MKKPKITFLVLSVLIISFFLNFLWEVSHSLLYDWNAYPLKNNIYFYIPKIFFVTLGDVIYTAIIFLVLFILRKNLTFVCSPKKSDYVALIIFGILLAIFIETKAKLFNLWSYNQYMPQLFGIGLTPLIQLAITSTLTLFIVNKFICKNK